MNKNLSINRKFGYFFGFLMLIFIGMAILSLENARRFSRTSYRIKQSRVFLFHIGQINFAASDARLAVNEMSPRQGKLRWDLYRDKTKEILAHIRSAQAAMKEHPQRIKQLEDLATTVHTRMNFLSQFVERRQSGTSDGLDKMAQVVAAGKVKPVMEEIRQQIALLESHEHSEMNNLLNVQENESRQFNLKLFALLLSTLVILATGFFYLLITFRARKEAEMLLYKNQQLLQSFLDNSQSVIFIKNLKGRYLLVNREYEKLFNVLNEHIQMKCDEDLFPPDMVKVAREKELAVVQSGKPLLSEDTAIANGEERIYQTLYFPLLDLQGNVYAVSGISTDITERKKVEVALQKAHDELEQRVAERTRELSKINTVLKSALVARKKAEEELLSTNQFNYEIISNAGEGFIVYDQDFNHVLWNTFMEGLSGIPSHKVIGRSARKIFPQLEGQGFFNVLESVIKGDSVYTKDFHIQVPETGKDFWASCIFSPHKNSEGEIIGIIGIVRDVTARKQTEEHLAFINKQLDTFIYKSSHDLKGPLCSIMGLASLAKREVKDELALKMFEMIEGRTQKLDDILKGLIDTMTIREGRISADPIDVKKLIGDSLNGLEGLPGYGRVEFRVKAELQSEFVSDSNLLRSILLSLLANSVKYQDYTVMQPYVSIEVKEKGEHVFLEISDNGEGIREEVQDKVFDIFFRDNNHIPGSGLGLYIVKNAVEKLQGSITLRSKSKAGTTVVIQLPRTLAA